jgi:hypothetical protein
MCRPLTRREMLRYAGLVAATPLLPELARPVKAYAATEARAVPMHLELVTLTESTAVLTWFTGDPTKPDQYGRHRLRARDPSAATGARRRLARRHRLPLRRAVRPRSTPHLLLPRDLQWPVSDPDGCSRCGRADADREDYHVVRGNHDRAHHGSAYASCPPAKEDPSYCDCLKGHFFGDGPTYYSFGHRGLHIVGLDTPDELTGKGDMKPAQFDWLEQDGPSALARPACHCGDAGAAVAARALPRSGAPGGRAERARPTHA